MPGLNCEKIYYKNGRSLESFKSLFGFYYCEIETTKSDYFGLLPVRGKNGLTFPLGKYSGWYFSEELKFAASNGYKIKIYSGYSFSRVCDVFKSYIEKIYTIKSKPKNPVQKQMAKSLLNNLLGRFGISLDKPVTEIIGINDLKEILTMHKVTSYKPISDDKFLISYNSILDPDVIEKSNRDIIEILNSKEIKVKAKELKNLKASSVVISAAVNSYARIHMQRLKLDILAKGGKLYYSDTDSLVTNIKLDESLVDSKALGKLKLEYEVAKGIFIAPKLYYLLEVNGKEVIRAKGINKESINFESYLNLLKAKPEITLAKKNIS